MQFKKGMGWKACFDEETGRYTAECGGAGNYDLYEITKELYDALRKNTTESKAADLFYTGGRHLYMDVNDRCGPPYTVVFDDGLQGTLSLGGHCRQRARMAGGADGRRRGAFRVRKGEPGAEAQKARATG